MDQKRRNSRIVFHRDRDTFKDGKVNWEGITTQISDFIQGKISGFVRHNVIKQLEAVPWVLDRKMSDAITLDIVSELKQVLKEEACDPRIRAREENKVGSAGAGNAEKEKAFIKMKI